MIDIGSIPSHLRMCYTNDIVETGNYSDDEGEFPIYQEDLIK